jgi:plasmid stabilization system protein ParE
MESKKIIWSATALKQFKTAINYIAEDSVQNAEKVRIEILKKIEKLSLHPEFYPSDKYKINNDNSYRAFELYHYRIAYRITKKEIRIFRVRHTGREPRQH